MNSNRTYYDILGVNEDASLENIRAAMERAYYGSPGHPEDALPPSMWREVDEAYSVLSNRERRREYDKEKNLNNKSSNSSVPFGNLDYNQGIPINKTVEEPKVEEIIPQIPDLGNQPEVIENLPQSPDLGNQPEVIENLPQSPYLSNQPEIIENLPQNHNDFTIPFNFEQGNNKLTKRGKIVAGVIGFMYGGPIGSFVAIKLSKHLKKFFSNHKIKLQKKANNKLIMSVSTPEAKLNQEYLKNLDTEIDRLLSEPHNNYKLAINQKKYEKQVELLQKQLELKVNTKNKKGVVYKLDLVSTRRQLEDAKAKLNKINSKIEKYNRKQKLTRLNEKLIDVNTRLNDEQRKSSIKRLSRKRSKLLDKRNQKALNVKIKLVRSQSAHDTFVIAKNLIKSLPYAPKSVISAEEFARKTR